MPKDRIEAAVARGAKGGNDHGESVRYEGYGPGNIAMIIEAITDNRHRTGPAIRHLLSKSGGSMQVCGMVKWVVWCVLVWFGSVFWRVGPPALTPIPLHNIHYAHTCDGPPSSAYLVPLCTVPQAEGAVSWQFDRIGSIEVPLRQQAQQEQSPGGGGGKAAEPGAVELDPDALFDAALDLGATDIEFFDNVLGDVAVPTAHVVCEPTELAAVSTGLKTGGFKPSLAEFSWRPKSEDNYVTPMGEDAEAFGALLEDLEENDDVQVFFHNAKSESGVEAE